MKKPARRAVGVQRLDMYQQRLVAQVAQLRRFLSFKQLSYGKSGAGLGLGLSVFRLPIEASVVFLLFAIYPVRGSCSQSACRSISWLMHTSRYYLVNFDKAAQSDFAEKNSY